MTALNVGLAIAHPGLLEEVRACLRTLPVNVVFQQAGLQDPRSFLEQVERLRPDVLLVDLTQLPKPFEDNIGRWKSTAASPAIIALNDSPNPETILSAVRAGAKEFLYPPLSGGLTKALEKIASERPQTASSARGQGRVIGFLSAKGGCGATTIACHVAVELQRSQDREILLADFDVDTGLLGFLTKAPVTYTMQDAARNVHRLDLSYWKALVSPLHPKLDVIAAPPPGVREAVDPEPFRHILRFVRSAYDLTVADLGRGVSRYTVSLLEEVDEAFLVANMELPALHQAKQSVQALTGHGFNRDRLRLILNRMPKRPDISSDEVEKILGLPVYATVPSNYPEVYEAYAHGDLLSPASEVGKELCKLARRLGGVNGNGKAREDKAKQRPSLSIF